MDVRKTKLKLVLGAGCALVVLAAASATQAEERTFNLASSRATDSIPEFARQAGLQIVAPADKLRGVSTPAIEGRYDTREALQLLIASTGLQIMSDDGRTITLAAAAPQSGSAAGDGADGTVEALIVTAQKREEDIQDVPIAISAFTQEDLTRSQIAGGPDLMTQVPNMTFTKTNFSSYSVQIRGIGTQAISATTDAAVAIAFNNTPFIRNRFFEQEFYDLQRVEVLRGPQGTLYGRNATAGVVNIISAKPKFLYEAKLSGDVANYNSTRLEGMVNIPLVEDTVALRLAGAWTKRDGFVTNEITGNPIDGRDLWSTRVSLRMTPSDRLDANLIWEHFEEDDDRLRSGKQTCKKDIVEDVGGVEVGYGNTGWAGAQAVFSQGCLPSSMYSSDSFETPNGFSVPYYYPLGAIGLPTRSDGADPYVSNFQSRDLRVIESTVDPEYRTKTDLVELQVNFDLNDNLTLTSETGYLTDFIFSTQDFNRFNTRSGAWNVSQTNGFVFNTPNLLTLNEDTGNYEFCDPQIGCADRLVGVDLSTAKSHHFSQEFRLGSNYDGSFNFSLGANFLRYDTVEKYYVFINSLSLLAGLSPNGTGSTYLPAPPYEQNVTDNRYCLSEGMVYPDFSTVQPVETCQYIDPNPIDSLNDLGHNYFLSKNPYKLISYAVFGEAYYNLTENLKVTAGLRWTVDKKDAPRIPSWVLAGDSVGHPVGEVVEQEWREPTGRLAIDWKPALSFTDETLLYFSYAHGYKAGGANPPPNGIVARSAGSGGTQGLILDKAATKPKTFDPEFVDAFEIGAKNTLFDGRVTLNANAFYYDYKDYQISYIVDRSAVNLNFDAEVWGIEIEADWRPLENLRVGLKGGYENTTVAEGERAIDLMERNYGHGPDSEDPWVVVRPFPTNPSNCVIPVSVFVDGGDITYPGNQSGGGYGPCEVFYIEGQAANGYDPTIDVGQNNGEGFYKDLSGNELPNAPHYTTTLTADYTIPLPNDWLATLHTDLYYQSEAWTRIFNMEGYDKLKAYTNVNLAAIFTNEDAGWKVMAYVKNVMDRDSITGAFLISDDVGLTTNVFLTEPRLYGLRVTKEWSGGPLLGSFGERHDGPYPFEVEIGGQAQRFDAPNGIYSPGFMDGSFAPEIDPRIDQRQDLDWGAGRDLKLTWRTEEGWSVSAAARFGKTNVGGMNIREENEGIKTCSYQPICVALGLYYNRNDSAMSDFHQKEEYEIADFAVGKDAGIGQIGDSGSVVSAGLRYAAFRSKEAIGMDAEVDWYARYLFDFLGKYGITHTHHDAKMASDREFKGIGPVLTWQASQHLLGRADAGWLNLDWSLSGGALFGERKTKIDGHEATSFFRHTGLYFKTPRTPLAPPVVTPLDIEPRSESVTVPTLGANLGLSYEVDRFKIGAGYRWERYYDAIDGGIGEAKDADRTIDGPYFKLSVGFGG